MFDISKEFYYNESLTNCEAFFMNYILVLALKDEVIKSHDHDFMVSFRCIAMPKAHLSRREK